MDNDTELAARFGPLTRFVYLDPAGREVEHQEINAYLPFLPEIGEQVEIGIGGRAATVKSRYFRLIEAGGEQPWLCAVTVLLTVADQVPLPSAHRPAS